MAVVWAFASFLASVVAEPPHARPEVEAAPAPLVRVEPHVPHEAAGSGYCVVRLSISADGLPFGVEAVVCSDPVFAVPAVEAVRRWRFPRTAVQRADVFVPFMVRDGWGRFLPSISRNAPDDKE